MIRDPSFRAAVEALQTGDLAGLERLLDAEPRLLTERIGDPAYYPSGSGYFDDPKLFWFIANNPNLTPAMPANIEAIAGAMIARGVARADLDYALELVMTSAAAREQGHQLPLQRLLMAAGAEASARGIDVAIAHRELEPVKALIAADHPVTLEIAAGLGLTQDVARLLPGSTAESRRMALAHAAINGATGAARLVLDAGVEVNAFTPVHRHGTALHHAALYDHAEIVRLLLEHGADPHIRDTLWNGTPLGWAIHGEGDRARAVLEGWGAPNSRDQRPN